MKRLRRLPIRRPHPRRRIVVRREFDLGDNMPAWAMFWILRASLVWTEIAIHWIADMPPDGPAFMRACTDMMAVGLLALIWRETSLRFSRRWWRRGSQ